MKENEDCQMEKEHIECRFCSKGFKSKTAFEEHLPAEHYGHWTDWTDFMKLLKAQGVLEILMMIDFLIIPSITIEYFSYHII